MILTLVLVGLAAGVLAGLFGIGGGVLIVPALIYFAGMPIKTATGTSLGALLLPVGLLGAMTYWKAGHIDIRASLLVALGLFFGALVGARFALAMQTMVLQRAFALFLVAVAIRMFVKA
ncbi:MAG TPA: sulfite exporter TauE/SafE family protein [Gemmatimonadales bacterium]|nr:sulfite exporter TauE/SafE family protein [Gemmatimonadales bacterium]